MREAESLSQFKRIWILKENFSETIWYILLFYALLICRDIISLVSSDQDNDKHNLCLEAYVNEGKNVNKDSPLFFVFSCIHFSSVSILVERWW